MNLKRGGVGEMIKMHNIYPCILLVVLEQEHFFNKKLFFSHIMKHLKTM